MVGARVFVATGSLDNALPAPAAAGTLVTTADLPIDPGGNSLTSSYVDGVSNGQLYFVRIGMLDSANNILQFYPNFTTGISPDCKGTGGASCPFAVTPEQVQGSRSKK